MPNVASSNIADTDLIMDQLSSIGVLERLPKWLNCVPLVMQWLWLSILYRSFTLPSACNPAIKTGGMVGEGKTEYFDSMGSHAMQYVPRYVAIKAGPAGFTDSVSQKIRRHGLQFPMIAKPNIGWCGYGVRLLASVGDLDEYLKAYPKNETLLLQEYLSQAGEAGLFYVRQPGQTTGQIIGITLRYFPQVIGDGTSTIQTLVDQDIRIRRVNFSQWHQSNFQPGRVPALGEQVRLSMIGSTRVGGLYCDGSQHITAALNKVIDGIAQDMGNFHVGRFDVRYESLELLQGGKGFKIMEVNGAGSEAVHAWDPKYSLFQSYRIIFDKQRTLFKVGDANRRRGIKPVGIWELARQHFHQQSLISRYPPSN